MERFIDMVRSGGAFPDLPGNLAVIRDLAEVRDAWQAQRQLAAQFGVDSAVAFLAAIQSNQELFDALAGQGVDSAALREQAVRVAGLLGDIPQPGQTLLQPLSDFGPHAPGAGLVSWKVLDVGSRESEADDISYTFDLGSQATLEFEAGDTWPGSAGQEGDNPGGSQPALLRLGARGSLQGTGDASLPLNVGGLGSSTANSASSSFDYYFDAAGGHTIYAHAVARRLGDLCNPFSLASLWHGLQHSDLHGVVASVQGSAELQLEVTVAEGFTIGSELAAASAQLTVGVKVRRAGEYRLVARRLVGADGEADMIEASIVRMRSATLGHSAALAVEVDLEGLAGRLRRILHRHQGELESVLSRYEAFLTPGTYVKEELQSQLDQAVEDLVADSDTREALKEAFAQTLESRTKPTLSKLRKLLAQTITDTMDSGGELISGNAQHQASGLARRISGVLGLEARDVASALVGPLQSLVVAMQEGLQEQVSALGEPKLVKLADLLQRAGSEVSGMAASAQLALQGLREVIGRYERLLQQLIDTTSDAVRTRVSARLEYESTATRGHEIEACIRISRLSEATSAAFDTLVAGDLTGTVELLRRGVPGISFDLQRTALSRFASVKRRLGFEMVFLGIEFGAGSVFDAGARVTSNGAGKVEVRSRGSWQKYKSTPREAREIRFVDAFELTAAQQTGRLAINLAISHRDESLKRGEVVTFLKSFEAARLLPTGTAARAGEVFDAWSMPAEQDVVKADINLAASLDHKGALRLLRLSERVAGDLTDAARLAVFTIAQRELCESGAFKLDDVAEAADAVRAQTRMDESKSRIKVLFDYSDRLHEKTVGDTNLSPTFHQARIDNLTHAHQIHRLCMALVRFTDLMGDIYQAQPALEGEQGWTESDYVQAQQQLDKLLRRWLKIKRKWLFWIGEEAHPRTVAFVGALIAMADVGQGGEDRPALSLTLVRRDARSDEVTLV